MGNRNPDGSDSMVHYIPSFISYMIQGGNGDRKREVLFQKLSETAQCSI